MKCIKDRCYSPTACGGFGYCREMNFTDSKPMRKRWLDNNNCLVCGNPTDPSNPLPKICDQCFIGRSP